MQADAPVAARDAATAHNLTNAADLVFVVRADSVADAMRHQALILGEIVTALLYLWTLATFAIVR